MPRLTKPALLLTIMILLSLISPGVSAVTTIIGNSDQAGRYPFGIDPSSDSTAFPNFAAGGVYQQVYDKTAFSGPVTITQIAFSSKAQPATSGPGVATYNFNIALSTTGAAPNGLSTNMAANRGGDFATVFSGTHTAAITANNQFDVVIDITPFTYDPAGGNLLLEINFNAPVQFTGGTNLYFNAGTDPKTSRAAKANPVVSAFTDPFALQTRFTTKGAAQVTLGNLQQTFDGNPKSVAVTTNPANLDVVLTYDGSATPPTNAGSYAVTATVNDPNFTGQASGTLIINKASQQIAFDLLPFKTFGDADFSLSATASSGLPVNYSASGNCTVNGNQVHITGAGTCTITASQAGNANVNAAVPVARAFPISKAIQQITFAALGDKKFGDADFDVSATASSNLEVTFTASGNCTVSGNQVHLTGVGFCNITAFQNGNENWHGSTPVVRSFSINKADQQITFDALPDKTFGDADFSVSAASSANLAVSFSASGNCTLSGSSVHLTGAGNCTITASQAGDANYSAAPPVSRSFNINKATAVITLGNLAQSYDGTMKSATATTAPAGLNVTLTYSQGGVPVTSPTNAGSYEVSATINDDDYQGSATATLVIDKATPTLTWDNPADITYGTALSSTQLNATANVAGTFAYTPAAGVSLRAGAGQTLSVSFAPDDTNNYETVSKSVTLNIMKATLTVRANDLTRPYGSPNPELSYNMSGFVGSDTQASATAGQPSLSTTAVVNSDAGSYPITVSAGTLNSDDYGFTFADGALSVTKADQAIVFGPLASKSYGDAPFAVSATVEGTGNPVAFASQTPAVCNVTGNTVTILAAGTCTIRASQAGNSNYNAAVDVDQSFNVAKATTTTTLESSANPSNVGQDVTFTARVASAAGTPSGTVQFIVDGVAQGTPQALNSQGIATVSTNSLTAGNHTITAEYAGDVNFSSSNGALAVDQTVKVATSLSISDASLMEGDSGTKSLDFTVTLSAPSNLVVNVDFATANGTATAGTDYQSTTGTLTFAPGDVSKTITVPVNGDTTNEPNKTFFVNLTNPQNAAISDEQGSGTILDDDAPVVSLSQNSYSFNEGAGHGDIIVTRTGDTSQPISVDYQTSDQSALTPCQTSNTGLASDRCDYATTAGTIHFAAGEQQKTIPLVLVDDAYIEGSEQLYIKLGNPQGAALGSTDTATMTITDNDTQLATENPIDGLDFFIRQLYIDFLGREPEPEGFAFWKQRMTANCPAGQTCDRVDTAFRFFSSDEFKERGYLVYLFYNASLGRSPAYAEWMKDVSKLNGFKTVAEQEAAKDAFIQEFINRQEFMNAYNGAQTGQTFVDALIQQSGVTPASRQQLIDNYEAAGRAKTLRAFMLTPEVQAAFVDRAFVSMLYFGFLRRDAEAGGFQFWMQKLNDTNHDYRFMVNGFLQSDECRFRFALIQAQP